MLHKQDILISVTLLYDGSQAIADSDVGGGVDYDAVVSAILPCVEEGDLRYLSGWCMNC